MEAIGRGVEVHEMNFPKVIASIYELQQRHATVSKKILYAHG